MAEPNGHPVPVPAPKTVLVVEDEVLVRMTVADDLMAAGFHVIQAANADEALRLLESPAHVDLVLTDIRMPGTLDGLALAARVRASWPALKIIVLSGDLPAAPDGDSADAFLPKPYNAAILLDGINQLLKRSK